MKTDRMKIAFAAFMFILAFAIPAIASAQVMVSIAGSPGYLLFQEDVRRELKLTEEQIAKVDKLMAENVTKTSDGRQFIRFKDDITAFDKSLVEGLDAGQAKRLKELWVQLRGGLVLTDAAVQKELGLSMTQRDELKGVVSWYYGELYAGATPGKPGLSVKPEIVEKAKEKLLDVVTPEQKKKLEEMRGKAFEFKKS